MRDAAPSIAAQSGLPYLRSGMSRLLPSLLLALALMLAPLAMIGGARPAQATTSEGASTAAHCPEEVPASEHEKNVPGMEMGCAIACAAVPVTEPSMAERVRHDPMQPALPGDPLLSGIHPEGETPPPRIHPEI